MIKTTSLLRPGAEATVVYEDEQGVIELEGAEIVTVDAWGLWITTDGTNYDFAPWARIIRISALAPAEVAR